MKNPLSLKTSLWVQFITLLRMSKYIILCSCHKLIFQNSMKNSLPMEASWWAEFRSLFRMSKIVISLQPPYSNFLKYHERFCIVGSVMMSGIQKFFFSESRRVLFLNSCHILILLAIMKNPLTLEASWNSENVSEFRSLLLLFSRYILIF